MHAATLKYVCVYALPGGNHVCAGANAAGHARRSLAGVSPRQVALNAKQPDLTASAVVLKAWEQELIENVSYIHIQHFIYKHIDVRRSARSSTTARPGSIMGPLSN